MNRIFALIVSFISFAELTFGFNIIDIISTDNPEADKVFFDISHDVRIAMLENTASDHPFVPDSEHGTYMAIDSLTENYARIVYPQTENGMIEVFLAGEDKNPIIFSIASFASMNNESIVKAFRSDSFSTVNIDEPTYMDWLKKDALKDISETALLAAIPFVTSHATVDTETGNITFSNTSILTPGVDSSITNAFLPSITYRWNGKRFVK
ncbi:MAG: hypothetical protein J1F20_02370 [Muribaculaceae bacterium]|nr:hypothetical protein [Muribaculaceae bacterium]